MRNIDGSGKELLDMKYVVIEVVARSAAKEQVIVNVIVRLAVEVELELDGELRNGNFRIV